MPKKSSKPLYTVRVNDSPYQAFATLAEAMTLAQKLYDQAREYIKVEVIGRDGKGSNFYSLLEKW